MYGLLAITTPGCSPNHTYAASGKEPFSRTRFIESTQPSAGVTPVTDQSPAVTGGAVVVGLGAGFELGGCEVVGVGTGVVVVGDGFPTGACVVVGDGFPTGACVVVGDGLPTGACVVVGDGPEPTGVRGVRASPILNSTMRLTAVWVHAQ